MLERARQILSPSARSDVPPFMVMDVIAAAARVEAAGHHVIHMEVGQPAAPAPRTAIEAARRALDGPLRYTEALGTGSLRSRIARHYGETYDVDLDPGRVIVTTGSSAGFILAFLKYRSGTGRFWAVYYIMVCGMIPFQFFRDGFYILNKQLFFNFLLFPGAILLLLQYFLMLQDEWKRRANRGVQGIETTLIEGKPGSS